MIECLKVDGTQIHVLAADGALKTTKAFTHGSIVFDVVARTAVFGQLPAVAVPDSLVLRDGVEVSFQLVAPDGTLRKQTRSGTLRAAEKQPNIFRIAGMAQSPRRFTAEDGWGNAIYKYRAYFKHPGLATDGELPEWLKGSISRQRTLWNRLAWLCRDARRRCSPVPSEELREFVSSEILPAIDAFNDALGRSKEKLKHPVKLKVEAPGLDGLWKFVGELRGRVGKGQRVPDGLLEKVIAFAEQFKADYAPLNEFLNDFTALAQREAAALGLKRFEIRPTVAAFKAALDRRKTTKPPWSEGWPLIKYPDSPKAANWGVHYYFNKAGVDSALLETGPGVPGLTFGPVLTPFDTGHQNLKGVAAKRVMREAQISIAGEGKERWAFRFGVLQHRPLPPNSHLKEWKLLFQDGALWLCLVVELQRPLPVYSPLAAGLDIGWRRTDEGIRFGTLYEPATETVRLLTIDFQISPKDQPDRVPFRIDLGPSRWEKRNIGLLFPDRRAGDSQPGLVETRAVLQSRRDYLKDTAKISLKKHLGEKAPPWLDKAGIRGLLKLQEELRDDPTAQEILSTWRQRDEALGELIAFYFARSTKRIEYGHAQVAHDVCRYLAKKGVFRLAVETSFLAKVAQQKSNEDPISLKRSQKYRQLAALGKFVAVLKNTATKYGIAVDEHNAANTTRICQYCNHLNPGTEKEHFNCENCNRQIKQDYNAAVNLSRFAGDPDLAEMAAHAGRKG